MRVAPDRHDYGENVGVALSQCPAVPASAATVTLYSADGLIAVQEEHDGVIADVPRVVSSSTGDDDLTSLTWLQDKNLLKSVRELPKNEYVDDQVSDSTLSNSSSASSSSFHNVSNHSSGNDASQNASYDPQVHVNSKPPFSFSCLIFMAIEDSADKALPVKDIYVWILNHFPYYRNAPTGWKNSVRHNLSLNKCFRKVDKSPNLGKGSLWMVEQRFRPCLIQALQKTTHPQYSKFLHKLNIAKKSENGPTRDKENSKILSRMESERINAVSANDTNSSAVPSSYVSWSKESSFGDEVDAAATAMLVLKHGAYALDIKSKNQEFITNARRKIPASQDTAATEHKQQSLNEDHNYGYFKNDRKSIVDNGSSNDHKEAIDSRWIAAKEDVDEQRKIVEGAAETLLNLAGIATYNTRKRTAAAAAAAATVADDSKSMKYTEHRSRGTRKEKSAKGSMMESSQSSAEESDNDNGEADDDSANNTDGGDRSSVKYGRKKVKSSRSTTTTSSLPNRRLRKKVGKK